MTEKGIDTQLRVWCCMTSVMEPHKPGCYMEPRKDRPIDYRKALLLRYPIGSIEHRRQQEALISRANSGRVTEGDLVYPAAEPYDAVEPPHYRRGPRVYLDGYDTAEFYDVQCIDIMREIQDPRLATAFKYIWRVAFGGKAEPWDSRTAAEVDARDINSAAWYLQDYLANPPRARDKAVGVEYNVAQGHSGEAEIPRETT